MVYLPQTPASRRRRRRRRPERLAAARGAAGQSSRSRCASWLATTTRRECGRILHKARRSPAVGYVLDAESIPDEQTGMAEDELLVAERHAALCEALTRLPSCCQRLIAMLIEDPAVPYAQISARLGIAVGSIGPSRGRCLDKLRRDPAIAALINAEAAAATGEPSWHAAAR
jgi:DNA-directed RNA polymerase specialized sigma24 family protein